jgi:hypothetical protein
MFTRRNDGIYFIEVPRIYLGDIEYKVTRGNWFTVECEEEGYDIDNRVYSGGTGEEVRSVIERWKDK